MRYVVVQFH